ncbi:uncharacterized protein Ecym_2553 [Eremothecium cymbalariae DBVPG|uniref:Uncharacterized protein n=1 Tax=Eremothecium cymbalariae (strain CBS 270.75 / DBVPG 7215 / KCTC 17166 / NRRL Y-17582) TaxID=931890 RepID=G8JQB5_ERECY|nr:Hypothetical protein Ecym_2553 [Eremothecium cymbalariae DBVPG\
MSVITVAVPAPVTTPTVSVHSHTHNSRQHKSEAMYVQYKRIAISELLNNESTITKAKIAEASRAPQPSAILTAGLSTPVTSVSSPSSTASTSTPHFYIPPRTATPSPNSIMKRSQGRPITQKLVGKFTIYDCKEDLILDLIRTECLQLLQGPSVPIVKRPNMSCLQKIIDLKEPSIYDQLKTQFQTNDTLQFIKLIRDHKGKLLRLETVPCNESQINIDFIKRNVCYPRYKSNMKFYLIRSDSLQKKFIYYHDRITFERERHLIDSNIEVWVR